MSMKKIFGGKVPNYPAAEELAGGGATMETEKPKKDLSHIFPQKTHSGIEYMLSSPTKSEQQPTDIFNKNHARDKVNNILGNNAQTKMKDKTKNMFGGANTKVQMMLGTGTTKKTHKTNIATTMLMGGASPVNTKVANMLGQGTTKTKTVQNNAQQKIQNILGTGVNTKINPGKNNAQQKIQNILGTGVNTKINTSKNNSEQKIQNILGQGKINKTRNFGSIQLNKILGKTTKTSTTGNYGQQQIQKILGTTTINPLRKISNIPNTGFTRLRRQTGLKPFSDKDKDGVVNIMDCNPLNPKKQGPLHDRYSRNADGAGQYDEPENEVEDPEEEPENEFDDTEEENLDSQGYPKPPENEVVNIVRPKPNEFEELTEEEREAQDAYAKFVYGGPDELKMFKEEMDRKEEQEQEQKNKTQQQTQQQWEWTTVPTLKDKVMNFVKGTGEKIYNIPKVAGPLAKDIGIGTGLWMRPEFREKRATDRDAFQRELYKEREKARVATEVKEARKLKKGDYGYAPTSITKTLKSLDMGIKGLSQSMRVGAGSAQSGSGALQIAMMSQPTGRGAMAMVGGSTGQGFLTMLQRPSGTPASVKIDQLVGGGKLAQQYEEQMSQAQQQPQYSAPQPQTEYTDRPMVAPNIPIISSKRPNTPPPEPGMVWSPHSRRWVRYPRGPYRKPGQQQYQQ